MRLLHFLLSFLFIISCNQKLEVNNKNDGFSTEDNTDLIEIALNSCDIAKAALFSENQEKIKNIYIDFYKIKNPLKREIRCYNIPIKNIENRYDKDSKLITVYEYKKITRKSFYISYSIKEQNTDINVLIIYKDNKWIPMDCDVNVF